MGSLHSRVKRLENLETMGYLMSKVEFYLVKLKEPQFHEYDKVQDSTPITLKRLNISVVIQQ